MGSGRGCGSACAACAVPEGCRQRPQGGTLGVGTAPQNKGGCVQPGLRLTLQLTLRLHPQLTLRLELRPRPGHGCRLGSCSGLEHGAVLTAKPCGVRMVPSQMNSMKRSTP